MKNYARVFIAILTLINWSSSFAQFSVEHRSRTTPIIFISPYTKTDEIRNTSGTTSPAYTVRVWESTDVKFEDSEVISVVDYGPLGAGEVRNHSYRYFIPIPRDSRPLSEIIGSDLHFQTCVEAPSVLPICDIHSFKVLPPRSTPFEASRGTSQKGVELTFTAQTIDSEVPFEYLRLTRTDRVLDQGPISPAVEERLLPSQVEIVEDLGTQMSFKVLVETPDSSPAEFSLQQCYSSAPTLNMCGSTAVIARRRQGYRQAKASSVGGEFNDRIRVQWPVFALSDAFSAYELTRCEANAPSQCVKFRARASGVTADAFETYDDFSAERGVEYIYTIDACEGINPTTCVVLEHTNIARSEKTFVGLPDRFEEDNTPSQASIVSSTTSELRSFHTASDDDWVRLELDEVTMLTLSTSAFKSQNVDTLLELYSGNIGSLELLEENDDVSQTASFSQIGPMQFEAGTYFVRATHFKLIPDGGGEPIIPAPIVPNYQLDIKVEKMNVSLNMAPVIDLLLSND